MPDLNSLFRDHLVTLRNAGGGGALGVDSTTRVIKDIPTVRAGVVVPDCDLNTEMKVYITANYP